MNKITMYKPNDRKIQFNDLEGAAEAMLKDGWRLQPFNDKKEPEKVEEKVENPAPTRRSRRKSV